jgi:hypothetical protein
VTPAERAALVETYRGGYAAVVAALDAAGPDQLDTAADGGWTPRQVVHHLADSEMTSAIRLRRLLAEDGAVISGYDEARFAQVLRYGTRPVDAALRALEASRATTTELLDTLTEAEWARTGTHTESGTYGVEDWLRVYAAHGADHAAQIRAAAGVSPS